MKKIRAVKAGIAAIAAVSIAAVSVMTAGSGNAANQISVDMEQTDTQVNETEPPLRPAHETPLLPSEDEILGAQIMTSDVPYEDAPEEPDYLNFTQLVERKPDLAEVPAVTEAPAEPDTYIPETPAPVPEAPAEDVPEDEPSDEEFPEEEPDLEDEAAFPEDDFEELPQDTEPVTVTEPVVTNTAPSRAYIDLYSIDPSLGTGTVSASYMEYSFLKQSSLPPVTEPAPAVTMPSLPDLQLEAPAFEPASFDEGEPGAKPEDKDKKPDKGPKPDKAPAETAVTETADGTEAVTTAPDPDEPIVSGWLIPSAHTGEEIFTARFDGQVQQVDAYTLVCMICATEMSPSFSQEALKAQAVAAYSYVKYHNVNGLTPSVLVKHEVHEATIAAVDAVFGQCLYYGDSVAQAVYTASTAGTTASAVNVWGGNVGYLVSVETPIDELYDPNWGVVTTYTADEMRRMIEGYCGITLSEDPANWIKIESYHDGRYVNDMTIDGQVSIKGQKFRDGLMHFKLKSWAFDVTYDQESGIFTFTTYGYGHGVGLSQNGANILGRQGMTYDQILAYYFPGTNIR
ncbi:MAG: SpoIID/LytB domain-containing protein [Oscillospiraceae bacterium]|nr:SpoIID/LytB domain-containing protein [Oscillospiraceae bacterium]